MNNKDQEKKHPFYAAVTVIFIALCLAALIWDMSKADLQEGSPCIDQVELDKRSQQNNDLLNADNSNSIAAAGSAFEPNKEDNSDSALSAKSSQENYFSRMRLEREVARGKELALLTDIIADEYSSEAAAEAAETRKLAISRDMQNEVLAETLLDTKGYGETVVILQEEGATVILDTDINDNDAAVIADTIDRVSGCGFANVIIVKR